MPAALVLSLDTDFGWYMSTLRIYERLRESKNLAAFAGQSILFTSLLRLIEGRALKNQSINRPLLSCILTVRKIQSNAAISINIIGSLVGWQIIDFLLN